uniref:Uncharacterized protein n=1 Tax=Haliea sp. ETY-M TaxID=1055105 RepID=A0A455R4W9_9GAMM|nr:hypothetical protein [Haliea sp. ETY-M]
MRELHEPPRKLGFQLLYTCIQGFCGFAVENKLPASERYEHYDRIHKSLQSFVNAVAGDRELARALTIIDFGNAWKVHGIEVAQDKKWTNFADDLEQALRVVKEVRDRGPLAGHPSTPEAHQTYVARKIVEWLRLNFGAPMYNEAATFTNALFDTELSAKNVEDRIRRQKA